MDADQETNPGSQSLVLRKRGRPRSPGCAKRRRGAGCPPQTQPFLSAPAPAGGSECVMDRLWQEGAGGHCGDSTSRLCRTGHGGEEGTVALCIQPGCPEALRVVADCGAHSATLTHACGHYCPAGQAWRRPGAALQSCAGPRPPSLPTRRPGPAGSPTVCASCYSDARAVSDPWSFNRDGRLTRLLSAH